MMMLLPNTRRGNTQQTNIGQVKPDVSRKQAEKLSGSHLTYNSNEYVEDPRLQSSGRTTNLMPPPPGFARPLPQGARETSRGFTLIELLVVVLIIGILAAVALPQYNKTVKKAQGREVLVALEALDKAMADYYLAHDTYEGISPDTLSVKIPDLKYFTYGEPGTVTTGTFGTDAFVSITPTTCSISIRLPNVSVYNSTRLVFKWEKGKRKMAMNKVDKEICDYFEGSLQQVGTEGEKCFIEY